jgi:hypothetical protein
MLVFEFKTYGKSSQLAAIDEAIHTPSASLRPICPK